MLREKDPFVVGALVKIKKQEGYKFHSATKNAVFLIIKIQIGVIDTFTCLPLTDHFVFEVNEKYLLYRWEIELI